MRFKTAVRQAAIVDGSPSGQADGILVDERASRFAKGRALGNLYVLVEISGQRPGGESMAARLAQVVRDSYSAQRGSVTGALQQAIRQANTRLFEENQDSMPGDKWAAGISCAVLRNEDLFIAQAGPAALYVAHGGDAIRFPDISPWLDGIPLEDADAAPLGVRREVHVQLFHIQVADNDTILLADSRLAQRLSAQAWREVLSRGSVDAALSSLLAASGGRDLLALVVRLGEDQKAEKPMRVAPTYAAPGPEPVSAPAAGRAAAEQETMGVDKRARSTGQALAALWLGLRTVLKRMAPDSAPPAEAAPRPSTRAKTSRKRAPRKWRKERTAPRRRSAFLQKVLLGIGIAIPIIVAAVVAYAVIERRQTQEAELQELWLNARARWVQTEATSDPATVRALMSEANELLDQLLERQPDHAEALELRERIIARQDESGQVQRVHWEGELMSYPPGATLGRIVVEGVHVFVLDRTTDQVYHHQLDEFQQSLLPDTRDRVLVRKGDGVADILVGDLIDMVWMPVGNGRQKAALVILESNGALLEYDPSTRQLSRLQVAASDSWQLAQLVGSHSGRFYLLDAVANEIWRYSPTPDGYSIPPESWLQTPTDLAGVKDMAVGDSIYLLFADGQIHKLSTGNPDTFDLSDWDIPPQGPTAIFTRPPDEAQSVYVADPGNSRIVQSGKDGRFERQFRLAEAAQGGGRDALAGVTALFVDEIGGRAYFLSGNKLYMMILPD